MYGIKGIDDPNFADVRSAKEVRSAGTLDGEALGELERVIENWAPGGQGVVFRLHCQQCSQPAEVFVSWPEIFAGAAEQIPYSKALSRPWTYDGRFGAFLAPQGCTNCSRVLMMMTPDECWRHIARGEKLGQLRPGVAQNAVQQIRSRAGGYQR